MIAAMSIVGPAIGTVLLEGSVIVKDTEFIKTVSSFATLLSGVLILVATNCSTVDVTVSKIMRSRIARIKLCTFLLLLLSIASFALSAFALIYSQLRAPAVSTTFTLLISTPILLYRAMFYEDQGV